MKYIKIMTSCKTFCGCTFEKCCCMFLQNVHPVASLKMFLHATQHFWSFQTLGLSEDLSGPQDSQNNTFLLPLTVPLFTHEGQSRFGGLSKNVLHILLVLCRTLEVELCIHLLPCLLALQSQSPRCVSRLVVFVFLDRLYVVVVFGLHASSRTDFYLHVYTCFHTCV